MAVPGSRVWCMACIAVDRGLAVPHATLMSFPVPYDQDGRLRVLKIWRDIVCEDEIYDAGGPSSEREPE